MSLESEIECTGIVAPYSPSIHHQWERSAAGGRDRGVCLSCGKSWEQQKQDTSKYRQMHSRMPVFKRPVCKGSAQLGNNCGGFIDVDVPVLVDADIPFATSINLPKLYLGGPMADCTDAQQHHWRQELKELTKGIFTCIDPTRHDVKNGYDITQVLDADLADINQADVIYFNAWRDSVGTTSEITYNHWISKKPAVLLLPNRNIINPWYSGQVDAVCTTQPGAICWLMKWRMEWKPRNNS